MNFQLPSWLPTKAKVVLGPVHPSSQQGEAFLGDRLLAQLTWDREGTLLWEKSFDAAGRPSGFEVEYCENNQVVWCARWVDGLMHGPVFQLGEAGRLLWVTLFDQGRGVDLWLTCGAVSEYREMADGAPHGLERWGYPTRPTEEGVFRCGRRHGVFRRWAEDGSLVEGFPKFYLDDEEVSAARYHEAGQADPSLPVRLHEDDERAREMPPVVGEAIARAQRWATTFQWARYVADPDGFAAGMRKP